MGWGGAGSVLETSQGGWGGAGSGFCDQPKGLPPGSKMGKTWDTGAPQGSSCRLNTDEQGVRVSKKRYPYTHIQKDETDARSGGMIGHSSI